MAPTSTRRGSPPRGRRRTAARLALACSAAAVGLSTVGSTPAFAASSSPPGGGSPAVTGGCAFQVNFPGTGTRVDANTTAASQVVHVPQSDDVTWAGSLTDGSPGSGHTSSGHVVVALPIGSITVKAWSESFGPASDQGHVSYDFPSVVDNVKLPVRGYEADDGTKICSGHGTVEVAASTFHSPLTYGSLGGLAVFGGLLVFSGRRRAA